MMNTSKLNTFLTLCHTMKFCETADLLSMTQVAVNRHICDLECDLGFPLFVRTKDTLFLTPKGADVRDAFLPSYGIWGSGQHEELNRWPCMSHSEVLRIGQTEDLVISQTLADAIRLFPCRSGGEVVVVRKPLQNLYQMLRDNEVDLIDVPVPNEMDDRFASLVYQKGHPQFLLTKTGLIGKEFPQELLMEQIPLFCKTIPVCIAEAYNGKPPITDRIPGASLCESDYIAMMTLEGYCATIAPIDYWLARDPSISMTRILDAPHASRCVLWRRDTFNHMTLSMATAIQISTNDASAEAIPPV